MSAGPYPRSVVAHLEEGIGKLVGFYPSFGGPLAWIFLFAMQFDRVRFATGMPIHEASKTSFLAVVKAWVVTL